MAAALLIAALLAARGTLALAEAAVGALLLIALVVGYARRHENRRRLYDGILRRDRPGNDAARPPRPNDPTGP